MSGDEPAVIHLREMKGRFPLVREFDPDSRGDAFDLGGFDLHALDAYLLVLVFLRAKENIHVLGFHH